MKKTDLQRLLAYIHRFGIRGVTVNICEGEVEADETTVPFESNIVEIRLQLPLLRFDANESFQPPKDVKGRGYVNHVRV